MICSKEKLSMLESKYSARKSHSRRRISDWAKQMSKRIIRSPGEQYEKKCSDETQNGDRSMPIGRKMYYWLMVWISQEKK